MYTSGILINVLMPLSEISGNIGEFDEDR